MYLFLFIIMVFMLLLFAICCYNLLLCYIFLVFVLFGFIHFLDYGDKIFKWLQQPGNMYCCIYCIFCAIGTLWFSFMFTAHILLLSTVPSLYCNHDCVLCLCSLFFCKCFGKTNVFVSVCKHFFSAFANWEGYHWLAILSWEKQLCPQLRDNRVFS